MKATFLVFFLVALANLPSLFSQDNFVKHDWENNSDNPYLGQIYPSVTPELFASGKVSMPNSIEFSPTFSPDGNELYFTRFLPMENKANIMVMKRNNGEWSDPESTSFSSSYRDGEPFVSHDGNRLYFSSNRPLIENGDIESGNIWYVERKEHGWSEPVYMGSPINSDDKEGHPSVTKDGTIYYHVISEDGYDIYRSKLVDGEYQAREKLSDAINTIDYIEGEPAIAPDESYLLFVSAGRSDRVAEDDNTCDLYISFKKNDDTWTPAKCLGPQILSVREENWPWISFDGKYIFFSSNRNTDNYFPNIYWVDAKIINEINIK